MSARHTPGPWRVGPVDDTRVEAADGSEVAQIDGDYNEPDLWPIMEANARLIAAAPELLEALEELFADYKRLADSGDAGNWSLEDTPEGKKALAAISKARGEA